MLEPQVSRLTRALVGRSHVPADGCSLAILVGTEYNKQAGHSVVPAQALELYGEQLVDKNFNLGAPTASPEKLSEFCPAFC